MDENKIVKPLTRKKNHYFEVFISKVLKQVSEKTNITSNAKQQLNSFLCILCKYISNIANKLTISSKKKTISEKEIYNSIKIVLEYGLLQNAILEGDKSVDAFKNSNDKGSRQNKAGIIFSPSVSEKFLRNFGNSKIMVTSLAPIYLSAVLEYLTFELLDLASDYVHNNKRVRITIRDIEIVVRNDSEFNKLFNKINISLLGGGVVPYIHPSLIKNNKSKYKQRNIAIKNIKKYQKISDNLIFSKSSFEKFVRYIFKEIKNEDVKISKDVFLILQHFIEQFIVKILHNSNFLAIHAGRVKLLPIDIAFVSYLINNSNNPYSTMLDDNNDVLSIELQEQLENYETEVESSNASLNGEENEDDNENTSYNDYEEDTDENDNQET
jgi:histone H2A